MIPPDTREDWIIRQARERPAAERPVFLDGACAGDVALRGCLEALLAAHEQPETRLATEVNRRDELHESPIKGQGLKELSPPMDADDEAVGQTLGRYKLLERVGEGGCGVVYVAEQTEPVRRRVALKVIKLGMDTKQVVARFEAERQALAMMDHPNIAKVLDAGATETGRPYFVMELVRGIRITDYCDQANLTTKERLDLFIKVCQAIQHAHQKGIIHRDIKPSNILVTLHDGLPVPKVIDFGIAKATEGRLTDATVYTQLHQFIGTPAYMSPEQAEMSGLDIDTRSDIYSLGVLLYELLTGSTPFDPKELMASGIDAMRKTIREKEPVRPSTKLSQTLVGADVRRLKLPASDKPSSEEEIRASLRRLLRIKETITLLKGDLDWIVMKCLEKDRTRRYDTANGLAFDLKRHLTNEPVLARPPSAAYRLQKAWRRNQVAFAAGALVAVALVAGITVSSWQAIAARRARSAEQQQRLSAQTERDKAQAAEQAEKRARLQADREKVEATHLLYVANMNLAQQAWDQNNIGRLRQLLEETQDSRNRGFEWYYWQALTHLAVRTLRGHLSDVSSVAFSPDAQRIVTGGEDRTAKVWEVATGRELVTLKGHHDGIRSVAFSPDGVRIVTGGLDRTAKVWEAASGRELLTFDGHGDRISSVAFSPDGQQIVSFDTDGTVKLWWTANGKERLVLKVQRGWIVSAAFSPEGHRIVAGSGDGTAHVWDANDGRELLVLGRHSRAITSVAYSPDGQRIVTGSEDQTAKLWDATTGKELLTLKGHNLAINSVAFSPNGQRIATGSTDSTARLWDAGTGKELNAIKGHGSGVRSVVFSRDGQWILTGSFDGTAMIWQAGDGLSADQTGARVLTLSGHNSSVRSVAFSPDGQRIITGCWDGTAKEWEAATGHELTTLQGHHNNLTTVAYSPDGQRMVTGSGDGTAKLQESGSGRELLILKGHRGEVSSVAFSLDGQRIVTGSHDHTAKVWEAASGRELLTLKGHSDWVNAVTVSPDGQRIATVSDDGTAKLWEAASGRELLTLRGHRDGVFAVAFSPDGQRIVTGSDDMTAKVWTVARPEQVAAWQQEERAAAEHLGTLEREWTAEQERQKKD